MSTGWALLGLMAACAALLGARPAAGQSLYAAGGLGPTSVLDDGGPSRRNYVGAIGWPGRRGIGVRVSGTETLSRLWLAAELTVQPGRPRRMRPYGTLGAGFAVEFSETDGFVAAGGGIRVQVQRLIFLYGEARLLTIPDRPRGSPGANIPITFGVGLGT
jgi:hypothetical protein